MSKTHQRYFGKTTNKKIVLEKPSPIPSQKEISKELPKELDKFGPYELSDGTRLSLPKLSSLIIGGQLCEKRGSQLLLRLAIVSSSGRYCVRGIVQSLRQIGLVSDLLYIPEIVHSLDLLCLEHRPKIDLDLRSLLDIDVTAKEDSTEIKQNYNLLLCGSGAVNSLTAQVINEYNEKQTKLKVSFVNPNSQTIIGFDQHNHIVRFGVAHRNLGILSLSVNPWSKGNRIAIICAGMQPVGTVASIFSLYQCITKSGSLGNNIYDKNIPAKIVSGNPFSYHEQKLWPSESLLPPLDVRNLNMRYPFRTVQ